MRWLGVLVLGLLLAGVFALPSPAVRPEEETPEFMANLERWRAMDAAGRQAVRERHRHWQSFSPAERREVRENHRRFLAYDPQVQQELASSHRSWVGRLPEPEQKKLRERMARLSQLGPRQKDHALAVGWFLHEAPGEVRERFAQLLPQARRRTVGGLRDLFVELPREERERLVSLPPKEKRELVQRILQERKARFARLFPHGPGATPGVHPGRAHPRDLLPQLSEEERRAFQRLSKEEKQRLWQRLDALDEPARLPALQELLRKSREAGKSDR